MGAVVRGCVGALVIGRVGERDSACREADDDLQEQAPPRLRGYGPKLALKYQACVRMNGPS